MTDDPSIDEAADDMTDDSADAAAPVTASNGKAAVFEGVAEEPGSAKPDPILKVDNLRRSFGGLVAVDVDHLEIQRGVITALIGPNGAGKTTFFNLLTTFDKPDTGKVQFNGQDVSGTPPHKLANKGMVRTFQLTKALSKLSVIENMKLGAVNQKGESMWRGVIPPLWNSQERAIEERADALLERFKLSHMRNEFAGTMSGGQRKLLEMARALMTDPEIVMLDEPMAGDSGLGVGNHGLLGKQNIYDEDGIHIPLIISGGFIKEKDKGRRVSAWCFNYDIMPTVCELATIPVPESVTGKSLLPVINGEVVQIRDHTYHAYRQHQRGYRKGDFKLIEYVRAPDKNREGVHLVAGSRVTQLFNIAKDPWESFNLADFPEYRRKVDDLRDEMKSRAKQLGDRADGKRTEIDFWEYWYE